MSHDHDPDTPRELGVTKEHERRLNEQLAYADMGIGEERAYSVHSERRVRFSKEDPIDADFADLNSQAEADRDTERAWARESEREDKEFEREHKAEMRNPDVVRGLLQHAAAEAGYALDELIASVKRGPVSEEDRPRYDELSLIVFRLHKSGASLAIIAKVAGKNDRAVSGLERRGFVVIWERERQEREAARRAEREKACQRHADKGPQADCELCRLKNPELRAPQEWEWLEETIIEVDLEGNRHSVVRRMKVAKPEDSNGSDPTESLVSDDQEDEDAEEWRRG